MAVHPRGVDEAIARFDEAVARYDGRSVEEIGARRRAYQHAARSIGRRLTNIGVALAALIVATIGFGMIVGPIGWGGLFVVALLTLVILMVFSVWPGEPKRVAYDEKLPNATVVRQLDSLLVRERRGLPAAAARRADAISAQLPLLESRLAETNPLDPLAQDARRLMGKHLPDLLERYEKVPAEYRTERDGGGLTVDERLTAGLDAAHKALDDLGRKLARDDMDALETQGRFIESRYKDPDDVLP